MAATVRTKDQLMGFETQIRIYPRREVALFRTTTGEFGPLSNMAPDFPIFINGVRFPTTEALYQACRFPDDPEIQKVIVDQPSPMTAKMKSKRYRDRTRDDWTNVRVNVMRWCLRAKLAQNWAQFGAVLEKTGTRPIVEESGKDDFWGAKPKEDGTLIGMNVLGRLLMELREQFREANSNRIQTIRYPNVPRLIFFGRPIDDMVVRPARPLEIQEVMFD